MDILLERGERNLKFAVILLMLVFQPRDIQERNITLVQPPTGHGGEHRGDQPRRRKGEKGGGAKRVE